MTRSRFESLPRVLPQCPWERYQQEFPPLTQASFGTWNQTVKDIFRMLVSERLKCSRVVFFLGVLLLSLTLFSLFLWSWGIIICDSWLIRVILSVKALWAQLCWKTLYKCSPLLLLLFSIQMDGNIVHSLSVINVKLFYSLIYSHTILVLGPNYIW